MSDPEPAWMKLLDWATGADGTPEQQKAADAVAAADLYGDPDGPTALVDELRKQPGPR